MKFQPGYRMVVLLLVGLPVLLTLGNWQLGRAEEKRQFESAYLERQSMLPRPPPAAGLPESFTRLRLRGRYDPDQHFLIDNQIFDGQVGYWVVTPFREANGRRWLINRGWIAAPQSREQLPEIAVVAEPTELVAVVWPDTGLVPLLAEERWSKRWPLRIQRLDVSAMAPLVGAQPLELRLEAAQPGVFTPAPMLLSVTASKHTGYAVQWFAFAGVLVVGFFVYGFTMPKRRERSTGTEHV